LEITCISRCNRFSVLAHSVSFLPTVDRQHDFSLNQHGNSALYSSAQLWLCLPWRLRWFLVTNQGQTAHQFCGQICVFRSNMHRLARFFPEQGGQLDSNTLLCSQVIESLQFCGLAQFQEGRFENQLRLIVGQVFVVAEYLVGFGLSLREDLPGITT
jgi:hypothetical protein